MMLCALSLKPIEVTSLPGVDAHSTLIIAAAVADIVAVMMMVVSLVARACTGRHC